LPAGPLDDWLEVVAVMAGVMAAEHVRVERLPLAMSRRRVAAGIERVAGRPDAHERLSRLNVPAADRPPLLRPGPPQQRQPQQGGILQGFDSREVVWLFWVGDGERAADPKRLEFLPGEFGQSLLRPVFVLADDEHGAGAIVGPEQKGWLSGQVGRGDRRRD